MREDNFAPGGDDEPSWDDVVALDPEDAAAIQVDPDVEDFTPDVREFEPDPDEDEEEIDVEEGDPDFDDDAEIRLIHDLGLDLDTPDGPVGGRLELDLVLGSESESEPDDAADDEVAA